jgi:hypothetical protein
MSDVTYVQRVNTVGGVAPATGCDAAHVDMKTAVPYTADYYFYKSDADAGVTADWPFTALGTLDPAIALTGPTLKLKLHAIGVQIYTCKGTAVAADAGVDAGTVTEPYTWTLKQPDAKLYDDTNTPQGTHGLGPNWTSKDGSIITGTKLAGVNGPLGTTAIQWLKLQVATHAGATGVFTDVTYVQRLNTANGVAPATGCDAAHINMDTSSAYTADYYFYTGAVVATDGGTD